ncbi:hypothetical protein BC831DRAFT_18979 [Entophlyctis helioformis]|nr:hypothetical protein BC831DRAFT_18979 [Entophlyctis helioformis]
MSLLERAKLQQQQHQQQFFSRLSQQQQQQQQALAAVAGMDMGYSSQAQMEHIRDLHMRTQRALGGLDAPAPGFQDLAARTRIRPLDKMPDDQYGTDPIFQASQQQQMAHFFQDLPLASREDLLNGYLAQQRQQQQQQQQQQQLQHLSSQSTAAAAAAASQQTQSSQQLQLQQQAQHHPSVAQSRRWALGKH